jgi:hypothetical protein
VNINTGKLNFQVSPVAIANERLEARMYQPFNNRGPYFYPMSPFAEMPSMRGLRGLGSVDVSAIAQAQASGQISPSFLPVQYFQPGYMAPGQLSAMPQYLYATQGFAQQIAGLLGGSVVSAPPPGNYQGTQIPNAYWVQLPDGSMVLPGNLFQPGTVLNFESECIAENYFAQSIPGGVESLACQGGASSSGSSGGSTSSPITTGGGSSVAQIPTFTLLNSTTGESIESGGVFEQGDEFQVVITNAAPNAPVTVTASQNGKSSTSVLGNTSSNGSFQTSGTMGSSAAGSWVEQWSVPAGTGALALSTTVSFTVEAPASTSGSGSTSTGSGQTSTGTGSSSTSSSTGSGSSGSSGASGSSSGTSGTSNTSPTACGLSLGSSDTSSCVNLGFMTVSTDALMVGAAIGAALLFFAGRGK